MVAGSNQSLASSLLTYRMSHDSRQCPPTREPCEAKATHQGSLKLLFCPISAPKATGVYEMSKLSYEATHCRWLWVRAKELSLGSPKRGLIEVSFLKRESAKDSAPCCYASCFKEVSLGPEGRCWFIPCACLFFYKHSCCIKWPPGLNFCPLPGKFSGMAELSHHPLPPVSSRQHGGPGMNSVCKFSKFARHLSSIHLRLENTWWKIFKPIPTVNIYNQLDDFFPNPDDEDPRRKWNTQNWIPGINAFSQEYWQGVSPNGRVCLG